MNNFHLGDIIYFLTDMDNTPYMIISITDTISITDAVNYLNE